MMMCFYLIWYTKMLVPVISFYLICRIPYTALCTVVVLTLLSALTIIQIKKPKTKNAPAAATLYLIQIMSPKNAMRACIRAQKQQSHLLWKQVLEKSGRLYRNLASLYYLSFHCVIFITYTVTITELNRRNDIIHKLRMITIIASELCV